MRTQTKTKTWEVMRRSARRILPVAVFSSLAIVGVGSNDASAASTAWGPERPTFSWAEPADYITFNSITDNPKVGDERNFVRIRKAGTNDTYTDDVTLEPGQEYEVYVWFHNNAKSKLNKKEYNKVGIAEDVRVRVEAPGKMISGGTDTIKGFVSARNANPKEVWDVAYMHSAESVTLKYISNSTVVHSAGTINGLNVSGEALLGDKGVMVGYFSDHLGLLPGCNEYAGYLTYRFRVDKPAFKITKVVSKENENNYVEKLTVKPGEVLDFKIDYKNTGTVIQNNIIAYDNMPKGLNYVAGTTFMKPSVNAQGNFISDKLFDGGANLGDYKPGDSVWLTYKVEVADDVEIFPCGDTVVYNNASVATKNGTGYDKVEITVRRDCEPEKVEKCKKVNDTYFGKDGKIVDKATYDKECGPAELPKTGPTEIVLALVIISGIGIGGAYYYSSKKQLKELENK